jgi:hypothetical protein
VLIIWSWLVVAAVVWESAVVAGLVDIERVLDYL